ncbi:hypothetical protein HUJ05_007350 [Dendroctonus ponderosae]|nr:hypothetical protein HUJ05_007350 [Dendroctonus ponderosae]
MMFTSADSTAQHEANMGNSLPTDSELDDPQVNRYLTVYDYVIPLVGAVLVLVNFSVVVSSGLLIRKQGLHAPSCQPLKMHTPFACKTSGRNHFKRQPRSPINSPVYTFLSDFNRNRNWSNFHGTLWGCLGFAYLRLKTGPQKSLVALERQNFTL